MDEKCSFEEEVCIIQTKGDSVLQTSECCSEVLESEKIILNSNRGGANEILQYCSTPLTNKGGAASRVGQQDILLQYKSFFNVECEEIIHQLQQGYKADKRKLEELDFSTIEAEPPPFCCTPYSILEDTTYRAKRRRVNDPDSPETKAQFCSTPCKNNSVCQSMEKSNNGFPKLSSAAPKCELFQITSKSKHSEYTADLLCKGREGGSLASVLHFPGEQMLLQSTSAADSTSLPKNEIVLKDMKYTEAVKPAQDKINPESPRSSIKPLAFRSFFFAECENIYNRLKSGDAIRPVHDASTIDHEPPPNLSSSITFLSELDSSHAKANSNFGVTQLDLEKINLNQDGGCSVQTPLDNMPYCSNTNDPVKVTVANTTEDMGSMHGVGSVADITQDIVAVCDRVSAADATQDIVTICDGVSAANATGDFVTMCHGMNVTQDIVTVCDKTSVSKATLDIMKTPGNVSIANSAQEIMTEHGNSVANVIQNIKMAQDVSVANVTLEIVPMCDEPDSNATPNIVMHGTDAEHKVLTFCNRDPATGHILNTKATQSLQDFKTKCEKIPFPSIMRNKRKIHCMLSAADSTPYTETCVEVIVSDTTQDIVTIHGKAPITEVAQDRVLNMPIAQKCVLMTGDATILKRAHSAVNVKNSINNMTFLCAERKPDQDGVTVGNTGDFVHAYKKSLSEFNISPLSTINSTVTISDSGQVYAEGSTNILTSMPSTCWAQVTQATKDVVLNNREVCNNITACSAMATSSAKDANQEIKESNITLSITSRPYKATTGRNLLETDNKTEVTSADCTPSIVPRITQPNNDERGCRVVSPSGVNKTGSICDLDVTHIASEESVFCEGSFSFTTSTPLPCINHPVFIKKSRGGSIQADRKLYLNRVQKEAKQMAIPKLVSSGQPTRGNITQIRPFSKVFPVPCPSKSSLPRLPKPVTSIPTLLHPVASTTVIKTPQITRSVTLDTAPVGPNKTNRIPVDTAIGLPKRNVGIAQKGASNTANRIPQQKDLANCFRANKGCFITGGGDTDAPCSARPPVQFCTPANRIHSGKILNRVSGPPNTVRDSKGSSLPIPHSVESRTFGFVRPGLTFIRTPAGPLTASKIKPPASAASVKQLQAAPINCNTRVPQ